MDGEQGASKTLRKSIKDISAVKLRDHSGQGSSKVLDTLALLQNISPSLEMVCDTLQAVQKELKKPQRDLVHDLELANCTEQLLAVVQAFLIGMGTE